MPNPSAAESPAVQTSTDIAAPDPHHPAKASEVSFSVSSVKPHDGDPPTTKSTEQQPSVLSTSQRLQNTAHDSLEVNPSAAKSLAAQANTDITAPAPHHPTKASEVSLSVSPVEPCDGDPPATESTEQQPSALSTSQRLQNTAYNSLKANPFVAESLMAQTSTDITALDPHHPAKASEVSLSVSPVEPCDGDPPATESTEQQPSALSTSQRLWKAAYDSLEGNQDTVKLVKEYLKIVNTEISSGADMTAELEDATKRQAAMERLVKEGRAKVMKVSKISKGVADFAQAILSVKPVIDLALQNIPQAAPAALPWAGVCIGLQVSNPLEFIGFCLG